MFLWSFSLLWSWFSILSGLDKVFSLSVAQPWIQHQCVWFPANSWPPVLSRPSPVKAAAQTCRPPARPLLLIVLFLLLLLLSAREGKRCRGIPVRSRGGDGNKRRPVFRRPLLRLQRMWKQWASWDVHPSRAFKAKARRKHKLWAATAVSHRFCSTSWGWGKVALAEVFMTDGVAVSFGIVLLLASDFLSILSRVEKWLVLFVLWQEWFNLISRWKLFVSELYYLLNKHLVIKSTLLGNHTKSGKEISNQIFTSITRLIHVNFGTSLAV